MNRSNQSQPIGAPAPAGPVGPGHRGSRMKRGANALKGLRIASVVLLFSVTILIVVVAWYLVLGKPRNESSYIDKGQYQAVFLNGGQVYFGKVKDLNDKYLRMSDIFYLRVNQQVQPNQQGNNNQQAQNEISLVKLGCELHRPENEMLINREHIIFWENLKSEDGENTVPGAIKKYIGQYPNGQECQAANSPSTNNNSGTNNTNSTNINANPNNNTNTNPTN